MHYKFMGLFKIRREFWLQLVVFVVGLHGLFVVATTLLDQISSHPGGRITSIDIDIPLLIGFGLIYLSTLLRRRKQTAWGVAVVAYIFMVGFYANQIDVAIEHRNVLQVIAKFGLPIINIGLLIIYRRSFTVRSDIRSFGYSLRFITVILLTAFAYGTAGFMLMDMRDFHHEISITEAMHRTVDQFGLTTTSNLVPHTRRAHVFIDSLSVVSIAAVSYAAISLFQPIRARYASHSDDHELAKRLLTEHHGNSEDFFKLWPHDKSYFYNTAGSAGVAYKVKSGSALVVGDPMGDAAAAKTLILDFEDYCYGNDWQPVFVHTEPAWNEFYQAQGYHYQKIGEEAVLNLEKFQNETKKAKYFRQISNKFNREGFTSEVAMPPHSKALMHRLQIISDDWLTKPGRVERGFMMAYFSEEYIQQCPIIVARDSAGTIQGFLNQIPSYDPAEANFDLLRHASGSPSNINDFLLMAFTDYLADQKIARLNLGLCPLAGMDDLEEKSVVSRALHFVYDNGDRFYSFSGLRRFKAKYEPEWCGRYVVYKGGLRNFAKAMNDLTRAMRVEAPQTTLRRKLLRK